MFITFNLSRSKLQEYCFDGASNMCAQLNGIAYEGKKLICIVRSLQEPSIGFSFTRSSKKREIN